MFSVQGVWIRASGLGFRVCGVGSSLALNAVDPRTTGPDVTKVYSKTLKGPGGATRLKLRNALNLDPKPQMSRKYVLVHFFGPIQASEPS